MGRSANMRKGSVARAAKRAVLRVMKSQMEEKVILAVITAAATPTAGTVLPLTVGVIQGDAINMRSGDTIAPISLHFRTNSQAITNPQTTRFIVLRDNMNNGSTPAVTDVLDNNDYLSMYNSRTVYQQKRFTILHDHFDDVQITGRSIVTRQQALPKVGKIFYNGATAVATANGKGALFVLIIASNSSGTYDWSFEMKYHDA